MTELMLLVCNLDKLRLHEQTKLQKQKATIGVPSHEHDPAFQKSHTATTAILEPITAQLLYASFQ